MATGILAGMAGHIAQIDIFEASFQADLSGLLQGLDRSGGHLGEIEMRHEAGNMPGDGRVY